jgi:hypothetical protein
MARNCLRDSHSARQRDLKASRARERADLARPGCGERGTEYLAVAVAVARVRVAEIEGLEEIQVHVQPAPRKLTGRDGHRPRASEAAL